MEKKPKTRKSDLKSSRKGPPWIAIGASTAVLGLATWGWFGTGGTDRHPNLMNASTGAHERHERGTPLSPALFVGQTARTYQIAHDIPEILDQLYCYCECDKHLGHSSLLSCFIDSHAAT
ncbi:MAG: PCYCGC domain-containing protein [Deltaproteobacteria bacterium]|nr:PCYCGC domain-containing protein [Deltaproteobacteria bacterium]